MRTYGVGDIHGCLFELNEALRRIAEESAGMEFRIVFCGDYVDRGPDSRGVLERLMAGPHEGEGEWVCLRGNHEQLMFGAMTGNKDFLKGWLLNGGHLTLAQYQESDPITGKAFVPATPMDTVLDWINDLPLLYDDGMRYFVHAMIDPRLPLDQSSAKQMENLLWLHVRANHEEKPFQEIYGRQVVHGHSPQRKGNVFATQHRVNLDTGAVFGGALTYGRWDDGEVMPYITQIWKEKA